MARLGAILATAVLLRVLYVTSVWHTPFFTHLQTNAERYAAWAGAILDGHAPLPPFEQAPGYPYFVAAIFAVAGRSLGPVALVQALLDAVTCALIGGLAAHLFGRRAGLIAGLIAAAYGPLIYFSGELLPATLFVALAMAAVFAAVVGRRGRSTWAVAGCFWSLALAVRSEAILGVPLVFVDAWYRGGWRAVWRVGLPLAVTLIGFAALSVAASGRVTVLNTSGGLNLWLGNHPLADGVSPFVSGPAATVADGIRAQVSGDAHEADRRFRGLVYAFWHSQPQAAIALLWKKFVWTWTDRELPNTSDIAWQTAQSWLFRYPEFPLSLGMILPCAALGGVWLAGRWRDALPLTPLLVIGVGACVIFFTNARFRLIMAPGLIALAGAGLDQLTDLRRVRSQSLARLTAAGVAVGATLLLAWGNFYDLRSYQIPEIAVNTGILEREAGEFAAAVRHLRAGLVANPHNAIAWVHLALAAEQGGDVHAALRAYLEGLAEVADDPTLVQLVGRFALRHQLDPGLFDRYLQTTDPTAREGIATALQRVLPPTNDNRGPR